MEEVSPLIRSAIEAAVKLAYFPYSYYNRRKLLRAAKHNEKVFLGSINALDVILKELSAQSHKRPGYDLDWQLASAAYFASNLALDLNTAIQFAGASWGKYKKDFIWRTVAVTLYEGISQYSKYVMPALYKSLSGRKLDAGVMAKHRECAKRYGKLNKDYGEYLSSIRNNCLAHREINCIEFKQVRAAVSEKRLMECLTEFVSIEQETQKIFGVAFQQATKAANEDLLGGWRA